jgi:hypothetical protein
MYPGVSADAVSTMVQLAVYFFSAVAALLSYFTMIR